jgi:hypothetical protein
MPSGKRILQILPEKVNFDIQTISAISHDSRIVATLASDMASSREPNYVCDGVARNLRPSARTTLSTVANSGLPSGDKAL